MFTSKQQEIITIFLAQEPCSSGDVFQALIKQGNAPSLVTVKRSLSAMANGGILTMEGAGRSTRYRLSIQGRLFAHVDAKQYCSLEPDKRFGLRQYRFDLFPTLPTQLFSQEELRFLASATAEYRRRTKDLPTAIQKKELERLIIELSWKSSKIEGNTYTLLDTEKLILENKVAAGHNTDEARMILNHKDAFCYVREHPGLFQTLTKKNLEELHAILVKGTGVGLGLRQKPVGVIGSIFKPLDNRYQLTEAVHTLSAAIDQQKTAYAKALLALLGISYIQPFEDGNKRTARLMANALLLSHRLAPLSYRSVDESEYREATLVFYELNSLEPFKQIFLGQYDFAARNYAVA